MYQTTVTCPVCGHVFEVLTHPDPKPNGQFVAMMAGEHRRAHRDESSSCEAHPNWIKGWDLSTKELETCG